MGDAEVYRDAEEVDEHRRRDPIQRFQETLASRGWLDSENRATVWDEAAATVRDAEERAEAGAFPDPVSALDDVFTPVPGATGGSDRGQGRAAAVGKNGSDRGQGRAAAVGDSGSGGGTARVAAARDGGSGGEAGETRRMTFGQATVDAMASAMRSDGSVVVLGEDISWGGNFGQFRGLVDEFGPGRVIDMPISEAIIVAVAVGAATAGLRPVALHELRRVHAGGHGRDRQPGLEVPLHVRRAGVGAAGAASVGRCAALVCVTALLQPGGVVHPPARPEGGGAVQPGRRQGPAAQRYRRPRPGHLPGAQEDHRPAGPGPHRRLPGAVGLGRGGPTPAPT